MRKKNNDMNNKFEPSQLNINRFIFGISVSLSALITIIFSLFLSFLVYNTLRYDIISAIIFVIFVPLLYLLISVLIYKNGDNYIFFIDLIKQLQKNNSLSRDFLIGISVLIITVFSSIIFHRFRFFLIFGIMLFFVFFGLSLEEHKKIPEKSPLNPLPFKPPVKPYAPKRETKTYGWNYLSFDNMESFNISVSVNLDTLKCARSKPRIELHKKEDILKWVVYPEAITEEVKEAAVKLREISNKNGFYKIEEITNVLSMVQQSIPYSLDKDTAPNHKEEYPRYPIETLYDKTGDCECKTFLACAILTTLGYDVAFFSLPGHVALGVAANPRIHGYFQRYNGKRYYYYETTAEGWRFGQVPPDERGKIEIIVPVKFKSRHDLSDCIKENVIKKGGAEHK